MLECFMRLRTDAASGIDNITKQEYARNLYANIGSDQIRGFQGNKYNSSSAAQLES
jgi:hypothetical protein